MKKRIILLITALLLIFSMNSVPVLAAGAPGNHVHKANYSAIGDSICAGFGQADYDYHNPLDMNIKNSPKLCYASLTGKALNSNVFNLGKIGCDTTELHDILTNTNNAYYITYHNYITKSNLITLEIGSNDLTFPAISSMLNSIGCTNITPMQFFELAVPFLKGNFPGMLISIETTLGIRLTPEQINALMYTLTDEQLSMTLAKGYETFAQNFPKILNDVRAINPKAEFLIIGYYNPYKSASTNRNDTFIWNNCTYHIGDVAETATQNMNTFALAQAQANHLTFIDIHDIQTNMDLGTMDPHPSTLGHMQISTRILNAIGTNP